MSYNEKFAGAFRYGMMFGKDIYPGEDVGISVTEPADVLLAVKKAYIDMSPRTLSGKKDGAENLDPQKKEELFGRLANQFVDYMKEGAEDFEVWHHNICAFFIKEFGDILEAAGRGRGDATYGKAQKIINMTFKYLYCYDDAAGYVDRFAPCHMALDSYILNWVFDWYGETFRKETGKKLTKSGTYHLESWSNLAYEKKPEALIPQYREIQKAIREQVETEYPGLVPIEAEFQIWYEKRNKPKNKA